MLWYVNTYKNNYPLPPKFSRLSSHIIMLLVLGEGQVSDSALERKEKDQTTYCLRYCIKNGPNVILSADTQPNAAQHKHDLSFLFF